MNIRNQSVPVYRNHSRYLSPVTPWSCLLGVFFILSISTGLAEQVAAPLIEPIPTAQQEIDGFSPQPPGSGNPPVTLTITSATEGATIYYLIRDNNSISVFPTHLPPYDPANKPVIAQAGTRWVGAMAVKTGMENSDVVWQKYKIHAPVIELVGYLSFGQVGIDTTSEKQISVYNRGDMDLTITSITIESDDPGAWSHNFSGPRVVLPSRVDYFKVTFAPTEAKQYSAVFTVESDAAGGNNIRSASGTGFDPTKVAPVTINSSMSEPYYAPVEIWLYCATTGASLRYTTDGTEPTEASALYDHANKPTLNILGEIVFKARGFKDGLTPSDIASETFNVVERELTATQDFFWINGVNIGNHEDEPLVLENVGSRPIEITNIESDSINLTVNFTGPVTIPVGESKTYTVQFAPVERFDLSGAITISTNANGGDITRFWTGFGLPSGYGLDPKTKTVGSEGATYSVYVDGSGEWTPVEALDWASVEDHSNLGYFVVTVSENATGNAREGAVAVGELTHTIQQEAAGAVSGIDPESKDIGAVGGSYSIQVNIPTAWTLQGSLGWAFATPTEGTGPGLVTVTVYPNPNDWERGLVIPIGGFSHAINQAAASPEQYELVEPQFSPDPGDGPFAGPVNVSLLIPTLGASIGYTTDPNASEQYKPLWPWYTPGEPIVITETTTIRAYAIKAMQGETDVVSATFVIEGAVSQVASPQFSPVPATGPFSESVEVTLSTATEGASIRYTFDDSVPWGEWTVFVPGNPIVVDETTTIWARGYKDGDLSSADVSATYTVTEPISQVASPQFSPDPAIGPFDESVEVTLSTTTASASVRYTLNELDPHETWTVYVPGQPIVLESTATIWAYGFKDGLLVSEDVSATYTVTVDPARVAKPTLSPNAGEGPFVGPIEVDIASGTEGAAIHYTSEESAPTESWILGDTVTIGRTATIWVQATKEGLEDSSIASGFYQTECSYSGTVQSDTSVTAQSVVPSETTSVATWNLFLDAEASGVMIVSPIDGSPLIFDILMGDDGSLSATLRDIATGGSEGLMVAADIQLNELVADVDLYGAVTGELGGWGTLEGAIDPLTTVGRDLCGGYEIDMLYADSGKCYAIVGTDGSVVVIIVTPDGVDTCGGQLDPSGHAAMTTANSSSADLKVDADSGMSLKLTPQGADDPIEFLGLGDGELGSNRLVNLSTRGFVGTQSQNLIAGFVITGTGKKPVLIRAMGPALSGDPFNVLGAIEDPKIEVIPQGSVTVAQNDNWSDAPNVQDLLDAMTVTGAFSAASGSKDAMIVTELDPGSYTAKISGIGGGTGVAIVEVYTVQDLDTPNARQVNISTRGFSGTGGSIMILGLKADGNTPRQFLIRAVGPTLGIPPFNLNGVLSDPVLTVVRSSDGAEVATNDDWDNGASGDAIHAISQQLGAFALPRGSKDAVVLISLPTTSGFTVKLSGKNGETGLAIAEVYEVP